MEALNNCIFCKICNGIIQSTRVYEDDAFICIRDIQPQAKTHLLIIPKTHTPTLAEAAMTPGSGGEGVMGGMLMVAAKIAQEQGLMPGGYRCVINTGPHGGQSVFHLHLHLLGGEKLSSSFG